MTPLARAESLATLRRTIEHTRRMIRHADHAGLTPHEAAVVATLNAQTDAIEILMFLAAGERSTG